MSLITTGSFPKGLVPGVKAAFGAAYKEHTPEYSMIFNKETSDKAYEEYVGVSPFGLAVAKNEGAPITYDTQRQGFITRLTNVTFGLGFRITLEAMEDNNYLPQAAKDAKALAKSFIQAKEEQAGLVLTRAFATYLGGDGVALCVTNHPNKAGGTYSNALATPADLSEAAVEQLVTQVFQATDDRNLKIRLMTEGLVVAPADYWNAVRILDSVLQNNTGNNAVNALKEKGIFPKGVIMNRYFDAGNGAWFITTDADTGLIYQERKALTFGKDNDPDTFNLKFFGHERYAFGWADPRGIYGSAGAA